MLPEEQFRKFEITFYRASFCKIRLLWDKGKVPSLSMFKRWAGAKDGYGWSLAGEIKSQQRNRPRSERLGRLGQSAI